MNYPDLSIIIPTFNNGPELERAIQSVLNQDTIVIDEYNMEIIVVNDASGREYRENLQQLSAKYACIKLLHNETQLGPSAARNKGIKEAKGHLIGFLDADDEWPQSKLGILLPFFKKAGVELAGGKVRYVFDNTQSSPALQFEDDEQRLTHVHLGAVLVRRTIFDRDFYFDETLKFSEDVDWWMRLRENNINIVVTEATTLLYHVHGRNMSVNKDLKELQVLQVLHKSLQRRRNNDRATSIPQVKDFRIEQPDPLISIIIPLYNGKLLIEKTLNSVLSQTYTNWELCIVDDGSTDGGAEWIEQHYPVAKITYQINAGVAAARNKGIKVSNGEIVAFLDQDDEWMPEKLTEQWSLLKQNPYFTFVTCNQVFMNFENTSLPDFFKEGFTKEHRSFVPSAMLIRKHALITLGGFDESFELSSDMDLVRRLRKAGFKEGNVNSVLLHKWYHNNNASFDKTRTVKEMLNFLHRQIHGE